MADEKLKENATGFSGLSTLVSDVEDNRPASKPAPEFAPPPSNPPPPEPPPTRAEEAPAAPTAPQSPSGKSDSSSEVTTGKWRVASGWESGFCSSSLSTRLSTSTPVRRRPRLRKHLLRLSPHINRHIPRQSRQGKSLPKRRSSSEARQRNPWTCSASRSCFRIRAAIAHQASRRAKWS